MALVRSISSRSGLQIVNKAFRQQISRNFGGVSYVQLKTLRKSVTPVLYETVRILASVQKALYSTDGGATPTTPPPPPATSPCKTEITYDELIDRLHNGNIVLIDVREPKELERDGKIPQATNIPVTKLKAALEMVPEEFSKTYGFTKPEKKAENVVFYGLCDIKGSTACQIAQKCGFLKVRHYPGGFDEWTQKRKATG